MASHMTPAQRSAAIAILRRAWDTAHERMQRAASQPAREVALRRMIMIDRKIQALQEAARLARNPTPPRNKHTGRFVKRRR